MDHRDHVRLLSAAVEAGGTWADIGAGSGAFTLALAELLGPRGRIFAVDRDAGGLRAMESAVRRAFPDVPVETMLSHDSAAGRLELVDDRVRVVWANAGSQPGLEKINENLAECTRADGGTFVFGVVNGALVVATDAARARGVATAEPEAVEGASGSLVLRADAEGIARQVITQIAPNFNIPDPFIPLLARPFDELRGSVATSTDGMKGKFSLTLD